MRAAVFGSERETVQTPGDLNDPSHRFEALRHISKTFHEAYTSCLSGHRIGSILEVSREIFSTLYPSFLLSNNAMQTGFWSVFKVVEQVSIVFSIHRFFTKF